MVTGMHTSEKNDKDTKNVCGKFYVDCNCLDHALRHEVAHTVTERRGLRNYETTETLPSCR